MAEWAAAAVAARAARAARVVVQSANLGAEMEAVSEARAASAAAAARGR